MRRHIFNAKIHRAVVTHADLHYEGSVIIDENLPKAANIKPYEQVHVWNVTRGTRLTTYALRGEPGSRHICVNGAAAHGNKVGDLIIIATFCELNDQELQDHEPTVVRVDSGNNIIGHQAEVPGPQPPLSPLPIATNAPTQLDEQDAPPL